MLTSTIHILRIIHIFSGFMALSFAYCALSFPKGKHAHRLVGRCFFYAMTCVFLTAIPMSILKQNTFLFLIALFSYYLAFSGWRSAKRKPDSSIQLDRCVSLFMLIIALIMIGISLYDNPLQTMQAKVLITFGIIGLLIGTNDLYLLRKPLSGKQRIIQHLSAMLGATIATVTAFLVTNVHMQPDLLLWLGPTVIGMPIIYWWKSRVLHGKI